MKKILNIFSTHKYVILWTIAYVFTMWAILLFMFNFSIFNSTQWHKLMHAQLHGFAGFVFGILILSALPLYVATTTLIIRKKKPLLTLAIPKIRIPTLKKKQIESKPDTTKTNNNETKEPEESTPKLPDELPLELHSIFIRAQNRISVYEQNTTPPSSDAVQPSETPTDTLPLPADFDIELNNIPGMNDTPNLNAPVFTEITFDEADIEPANTNTPAPNNNKIIKHLSKTNTQFDITDDIVSTATHAIITHSDSDFWVVDNENWFANGKTQTSPINKIQEFATAHNLIPVIYLESTNIMDLDEHIQSWTTAGIKVITNPEEL